MITQALRTTNANNAAIQLNKDPLSRGPLLGWNIARFRLLSVAGIRSFSFMRSYSKRRSDQSPRAKLVVAGGWMIAVEETAR